MTSLPTTAANAAGGSASNRVSLLTTNATGTSDHMPRSSLGMNEEISEDEARRRREQLNRRPSYRMILKDLETCQSGDSAKSMKRELAADGIIGNQRSTSSGNEGGKPPSYEQASALSNGGGSSGTLMGAPSSLILRNLTQAATTTTAAASLLQVSTAAAAAMAQRNALNNMIPPLPRLLGGGIGSGCGGTVSSAGGVNGSSGCDIPSQPQPQLINTLTAANTNPMLSAVAAAILPPSNDIGSHFPSSHNNVDWQSSLLSGYQNSANSSFSNALSGMSGGGAPIGLSTRQGSASLTSLSDNNDNNDGTRKRQVRLLKNREAAKECRRKKKEYVKCLENRVAVLENQNKALIEELKTLKELYCRKEKTELQ